MKLCYNNPQTSCASCPQDKARPYPRTQEWEWKRLTGVTGLFTSNTDAASPSIAHLMAALRTLGGRGKGQGKAVARREQASEAL